MLYDDTINGSHTAAVSDERYSMKLYALTRTNIAEWRETLQIRWRAKKTKSKLALKAERHNGSITRQIGKMKYLR